MAQQARFGRHLQSETVALEDFGQTFEYTHKMIWSFGLTIRNGS